MDKSLAEQSDAGDELLGLDAKIPGGKYDPEVSELLNNLTI